VTTDNIAIRIIDFVIRNFGSLYRYFSSNIDYIGLSSQLKSLGFIVNYLAEMIRLLGSLYI
jgi:hypothetical protein